IATFVLQWAAGWGLWRIAVVVVALAVIRFFFSSMRNMVSMVRGSGAWMGIPGGRRIGLAGCACLAAILIAVVPIPRYRHVTGVIRVRDAALVYLPRDGVMQSVDVRVGDRVTAGQTLAEVADPALQLKLEENRGRQSVVRERVHATRLASLRTGTSARDWRALEAASESLASSQSHLQNRIESLRLVSPQSGVVLPSSASVATPEKIHDWRMEDPFTLRPTVGQTTEDRVAWCRVASDTRLEVVLNLNASDRDRIAEGVPVKVTLPSMPGQKVVTKVRGESPMEQVDEEKRAAEVEEELAYEAVCDFPVEDLARDIPLFAEQTATTDRELDVLLRWDGASCQAVLRLPPQSLWKDAKHSIERLLGI
ncbi:MAG: efflux RND transporter periplasmic adaptor subunit, partial [Rhodopirellula sp. JB055]|uniref:efflux RND transporter periplasmic adaptor subunit n=1 Tax=Rhodopirellula sp. JB055 TaxID=3342846 RepID=UPI00370C8E08